MSQINRIGKCPNCSISWDGGDILESLTKMDVNLHKSEVQLKALAGSFGWSEFNKTRFSKVVVYETEEGRVLYQCPEIRCGHVFESTTGKEYDSIINVKREKEFKKEPEFDKDGEVTVDDFDDTEMDETASEMKEMKKEFDGINDSILQKYLSGKRFTWS